MQNSSYSQLDLFGQEQEGNTTGRPAKFGSSFLSSVQTYEKIILLIIGFVITGIISFSLGVEKGKTLAYQPKPANITPQKSVTPLEPQVQQIPAQKQNTLESYTIQLASYQTKTSLQKEVWTLKKKGFSPLVLSKGKYMVLCVGNFSDREKAKSVLSEFEKQNRYQGCFIRRL